MLKRDLLIIGLLGCWVTGLGGCATTAKRQSDYEVQAMRNRVSFLDAQIANLTSALEKEKEKKQELLEILKEQEQRIENLTKNLQKKESKEQIFPKSRTKSYYSFVIRIQAALKNAGFNPGLIDGKLGKRTRDALKEFQRANGLPADGRVDKQTWTLLRNYL